MAQELHGMLRGMHRDERLRPPEYTCWKNMIQRCTNPHNKDYRHYGERGITVCDRWRTSFSTFLVDMGRRPAPRLTIERKDNDRGYEPDNCCWASYSVQARNKRRLKPHEQAPYWMKYTWDSRRAATADEYICVFPKNMPAAWRVGPSAI